MSASNSNEGPSNGRRLEWPEIFMGIALTAAERSPDEKTKVGACLVSEDGRVMGIGYNSKPRYSTLKWTEENKHKIVCHAEINGRKILLFF